MNNLILRALTGLVFVVVIISGIVFHPIVFYAVFALVTTMTVYEFCGLIEASGQAKLNKTSASIGAFLLFTTTFLYVNDYAESSIYVFYLLYVMICIIAELYRKAANPINNWAFFFFSQIYCAGSFSLLNILGNKSPFSNDYSPIIILSIFVFIWLNDTGAYLIGCTFGKHRLFERISPKKSWEGFFGGLAVALIGSQIFARIFSEIEWYNWLGLAVSIVVFGTWGDLVESLLKRTIGVKDSGNILPGHGGMLDRFDSVIMAIPAAYAYITLFVA